MSEALHIGLRTEIIESVTNEDLQFKLVKLWRSKDVTDYTLHISPRTFTTYGLQLTDFLDYLSFELSDCTFFPQNAFCRKVEASFNLAEFIKDFRNGYSHISNAENTLNRCGFVLPQTQGWRYFRQNYSHPNTNHQHEIAGDGHNVSNTKILKNIEDENFKYVLTYIHNSNSKGWVTHIHPRHYPLSVEILAALQFLRLKTFVECPEFEFQECYWRSAANHNADDDFFNRRAVSVNEYFDELPSNFSTGVKYLIESNAAVEPHKMGFLNIQKPITPAQIYSISKKSSIQHDSIKKSHEYEYDVAISFAGTERTIAEELSTELQSQGVKIFYDNFYPDQLWGKDLLPFFDEIYSKQSKYCIILISHSYLEHEWTIHERKSALARALKEKGNEYILPIKIDDVELPGLPSTIGYIKYPDYPIEKICELVIKKLEK